MTTHEARKRSSEVVDLLLDLVVPRLAGTPESELHDELLALAIGFQAWAMTIEAQLPERDRAYTRKLSAQIAETIEVPT